MVCEFFHLADCLLPEWKVADVVVMTDWAFRRRHSGLLERSDDRGVLDMD
jgi:hypothetical protein